MLICALSHSGLRAFNAINLKFLQSQLRHPEQRESMPRTEQRKILEGKLPDWIPCTIGIVLNTFSSSSFRQYACKVNTSTGKTQEITEKFIDGSEEKLTSEFLNNSAFNESGFTSFHDFFDQELSKQAEQTAKEHNLEY